MGETVPVDYFIDLYKREADPWNFETSPYEQRKYRATLDALPLKRYTNGLEIACSIGVFTSMLAARCDKLLAVDVSPDALTRARANCSANSNVRFTLAAMPRDYPAGTFDLTTICEVGFYLSQTDLARLRDKAVSHCAPGGHIVLVHWTPPVDGHATTADEVHECFRASPHLWHLQGFSRETYRLDVLERR